MSLCLNLLARLAVKRKVSGSLPPIDDMAHCNRGNLFFSLSDINYVKFFVIIALFRKFLLFSKDIFIINIEMKHNVIIKLILLLI